MKGLVLAAGEGVRLHPLTLTRSKHMLPVGGKPIIEHVLLALSKAGIDDIGIVVGYRRELVQSRLGDGSKFGIRLSYIVQEQATGTAGAIGLANRFVGDKKFFVTYGDLCLGSDSVRRVINASKNHAEDVTLAVLPVLNPEIYGVVKLEGKRVMDLVEKPSADAVHSNLANAGLYVFSPRIFEAIQETALSSRGEFEITDSVRLLIQGGCRVSAVEISSSDWLDVGRPWDLLDANQRYLSMMAHHVEGNIEDNVYVKGNLHLGKDSTLRSGTYIEGPVFIGEKCDVGPNAYMRPSTSIGNNVRVGSCCEIKSSIIFDRTQIPHLSYVGDSVIGENCNLGAGTKTANLRHDGKPVFMEIKGIRVNSGRRKLGTVMGDNVKTGVNVTILPGVKIGPGSWINAHQIVSRDVPAESLLTGTVTQDLQELPSDRSQG